MNDDEATAEEPDGPDHARLTDDELLEHYRRQRRESTQWAAALLEIQRRGDRLHSDERFRAALSLASDGLRRRDDADSSA